MPNPFIEKKGELALAIALTPSVAEASTESVLVKRAGERGVYARVEKTNGDDSVPAV